MTKKRQNLEELLTNGKALVEFYREHPCTAAYELLGVDLAPIQRLVFRDMWFKNYVITVAGRGFGKSQDVESISNFNGKGLVYLKEELPPIPPYLMDGEEEIVDWSDEVFTSEGFRKIKKLCLEKGIIGKELTTQNNFSNKGSSHHPLLILNNTGDFIYKSLSEFEIGDRVCIQRNQQSFGTIEINNDDAYLIGLFIGDGSIKTKHSISITTEDESTKSFCITYCLKNNISYRKEDDKRTKNTSKIYFKQFIDFFEKYGVDRVLSYDKSVPYSIRTATKDTQIAFLQGYFDADGTAHNTNGGVSCCSVSKKLLKEIQLMLLNFGIVSRLRKKKTKSNFGKAYLLDMFSEDSFKFKELIGFRLNRKQKILDNYFDTKKLNVNKDTIPYTLELCYSITKYYHNTYTTSKKPSFRIRTGNKKEITYERLHRFLIQCREIELAGFNLIEVKKDIYKLKEILKYNYYFDTVVSIKKWKGDCYDFEMDMPQDVEPNYFSNGFINHNTFMLGTLAALGCLLYPGYRVGLIGPVFRQSTVLTNCNYSTFWSSSGLITGAKNFYDCVEPNVTKVQSLNSQNTVLSKWKNKDRACMTIKTTKGFELSGSIDHPIEVLDSALDLEFKELQDIKNEHILIKTGFNYFGNNNSMPKFDEFTHCWRTKDCLIPKELTPDLSYWMGLLVGDGCVSVSKNKRKQRVNFVNEDKDLLDSFEGNLRTYFCIDKEEKINRRNRKNNTWEMEYFCKKLIQYLLKCGFTKTTALDKKIPSIIKKASKDNLIAFIQGIFDTDGCFYVQKNKGSEISLSTSSKQLAKEVQAVLLNLGIISNFGISKKACIKQLSVGNKPSICAEAYKVRITGQTFIKRYNDIVGFRCKRKKDKLNDYIQTHFSNKPGIAKAIGLPNSIVKNNEHKCKEFYNQGLFFVKVKEVDYFFSDTIDIEVENEACYWANGFINHNSKMIFAEVEKLYDQSSILREATAKRPTRGSDTCYLKFKSVAGKTPSYIEALPLGTDGSKIRGSRFYLILVDELAQVPDQTLDMVLLPMGATSLAPMERVRRIEEQKRMIEAGFATTADFMEEKVNKMVMTSSGYYKFNHMWKRMKDHWSVMEEDEKQNRVSQYSVWQVPYWDLPEGFLDMNNINKAKRIMSTTEYAMEYEAAMVSDSEGFFKASLLDECTLDSDFTLVHKGEKGKNYIIGIDPNQGGSASCGIIILEHGKPNKVVNVLELKAKTTQDLTKAVQSLCDQYKVLRIFMDRGGGGKAVMDLLEEGYNNVEPILDRTNPDNVHKDGRHILEMVNFNPGWISDANFTTKSMFEDKTLRFPALQANANDLTARNYLTVEVLKSQLLSIVVTQTATGILHFDTPTKSMNKDLYSALILAAHGARMIDKELEEEDVSILCTGGLVRQRNGSNTFDILDVSNNSSFGFNTANIGRVDLVTAVLQKKKK